MANHATSLATGFQLAAGMMVFALALTALFGRWLTADESGTGVLLRGALLIALAAFAIRHFGTIWYWLALPLATAPLAEVWFGKSGTASSNSRGAQAQLAWDTAAAAQQPFNAILRLNLARSLLETGQIEAGISAMDEALALAPEDGYVSDMAAEAKERFVRHCPSCGHPNALGARVCRRCVAVLEGGNLLRVLLWLSRPALIRLRRTA
jgi:hypothetical protein